MDCRKLAAVSLILSAAAPAPAAPLSSPTVGYAQATGYYKRESRPSQYQPLNLLDGREGTAWCGRTSDNLADVLSFGLKGTATVDEVRIYTGNGFDQNTFQQFPRAKKLTLKSGTTSATFIVADQRGLQAISLAPALTGAHFTLEVLDQYPAEDPEMPVCLTDVVFYSEGKPLNGPWLTGKLKYDRQRAPLLGTWFGGYEGAPDRSLSFYFDETFRYEYTPLDSDQKAKLITGTYGLDGSRVVFNIPGRGKYPAALNRERKVQENGSVHHTLSLQGSHLPSELNETFRDLP